MKIVSIRLTRGRLAAMVIGAAVLLIGLLLLLPDKEAPAAGTEQQRQQYLIALGLDPEPGSEQVQAVRLPAEFTGIYREYQAIQTACGYDLAPYRGREVLLCRWRLRGGEEPMGAELLVWDGQVIGGSKYTLRIDGGLWGLTEN
jgi:hypothetical protein